MRAALVVLTAGFIMLTVSAWAKPKSVPPQQKSKNIMTVNLLKRCNDGVAVACADYGKILLAEPGIEEQRKGNYFLRRACTMAYAPACVSQSTVAKSKPVKDAKPAVDSKGNPCTGAELAKTAVIGGDGRSIAEMSKGSLWEQSGVLAGDQIVSINGQPFVDQDQIAQAVINRGTVVNLLRNGRETSVMIRCP